MAIMLSDNDRAFTVIKDSASDPDLWPKSRRSFTVLPPPRLTFGHTGLHIREAHPSFAVLGQEEEQSPDSDNDTVRENDWLHVTKVFKMPIKLSVEKLWPRLKPFKVRYLVHISDIPLSQVASPRPLSPLGPAWPRRPQPWVTGPRSVPACVTMTSIIRKL